MAARLASIGFEANAAALKGHKGGHIQSRVGDRLQPLRQGVARHTNPADILMWILEIEDDVTT